MSKSKKKEKTIIRFTQFDFLRMEHWRDKLDYKQKETLRKLDETIVELNGSISGKPEFDRAVFERNRMMIKTLKNIDITEYKLVESYIDQKTNDLIFELSGKIKQKKTP